MKKVIFYILGSAFFFSTMEVTLKIAAADMDALQLTFIRFMAGGLFLLPFALREMKKNKVSLNVKDYLYMFMLGIICIPVSMVFFQLGVMYSNASTAAVIFCVNPIFTMLFAHFIIAEHMNKKKGAALIIAALGIIFMIEPWDMPEGNSVKGIVYIIFAALTFGIYSVLGKKSIAKIGSITQTAISFIMGSGVLLAVNIFFDAPIFYGIGRSDILIILYISVGVTGLGYLFYFMAIHKSDAATGSIVFFIKPALAPVFAVIIMGEHLGIAEITGIVLILVASFINLGAKVLENLKQEVKNDKA